MTSPATTDLVAAVERAVDRHGMSATIEQIAHEAGLNRVTLYRRGLSRQRLLAEAAIAAAEEFRAATLPALTHPGTGRDRLEALLTALFDIAERHLALLAGLFDGAARLFHLDDDSTETHTRLEYVQPFERVLRDGNADNSLRSSHPKHDAELIFNLAGWTYVHLRRSHGWTPTKARSSLTTQIVRSYAHHSATDVDDIL